MEGKLRTNVISKRYTFHVMYRDKYDEIITVEAESVERYASRNAESAVLEPQDSYSLDENGAHS